ncbi:MAG: S8 family serine peptidase [Phycisphaerales bacterium]|nr:MAG: S8 family serine peptidase [Phycisphaerales bacterium]
MTNPNGADEDGADEVVSVFEEDVDPAVADLAFVANELLVRSYPGAEADDLDEAYAAASVVPVEELPELQTAVLRVEPDRLVTAATVLADNPLIEAVQKCYVYQTQAVPDDPRFESQDYLSRVGLPQAWDLTTGAADIVIAVLDTGVSGEHGDLASKVITGWNVLANNTDSADRTGHGTSVAGIAGAASNNGTGIAGVSWASPLMPVMVTEASGQSTSRFIAKGLVWSVRHGARIVNVSFAPLHCDRLVLRAARHVRASGGLVFISAGNDGRFYEAGIRPNAVYVGAVNASNERASFSTAGPFVDLVAPGTSIIAPASDGGYSGVNGTSFANSVAAGVAALVWSVRPELRPSTVADILFDTATDAGPPGRDAEYGEGIIDAAAAVAAATDVVEQVDASAPLVSITAPIANATVSGMVRVSVQATDASDIADVVLSLDGQPTATDTEKPFRFVINADKLQAGIHTLSCVATDEFGNASRPDSVTVFVARSDDGGEGIETDAVPPRVIINFPIDGTIVSSSVGVQATVTDNAGLASVEWLMNGSVQRSQPVTGTYSVVNFVWDASPAAAGSYTITVRATDRAENHSSDTVALIKS